MKTMRVKVTYTEEVLGSSPSRQDIYRDFIASKAPDAPNRDEMMADEIAAVGVDGAMEKGKTVFPRLGAEDLKKLGMDEGADVPFTWDYQWKGYFKDACGMLRRATGMKSAKLKAYKKVIDGNIFVHGIGIKRKIPLVLPEGGTIGECQRPLRAETAQGSRVALAYSETVPAGTTQDFKIILLDDSLVPVVREWMDYGMLRGFGQWRNSGKGLLTWAEVDEDGEIIYEGTSNM